jgi:hypothetical protein
MKYGSHTLLLELEAALRERDERIKELEAAFKVCHGRHEFPIQCAELVDTYFHRLYPLEWNPHARSLEEK